MRKMNGTNIDFKVEEIEGPDLSRGLADMVSKKCDAFFARKGMKPSSFRYQIKQDAKSGEIARKAKEKTT